MTTPNPDGVTARFGLPPIPLPNQGQIGLFIDCRTQSPDCLPEIIATASAEGELRVRRAYGDWTRADLATWLPTCDDYAVNPIFVPEQTSSAVALTVDVMAFSYAQRVDAVCIASSGGNFTPLVRQLRENGIYVLGIQVGGTVSTAFRQTCSRFVRIAGVDQSRSAATAISVLPSWGDASTNLDLPPWEELMIQSYENSSTSDGWMHLGWAGNFIRRLRPDFSHRAYGFSGLLELVQSNPDLFEVESRTFERGDAPAPYVRLRREADDQHQPK